MINPAADPLIPKLEAADQGEKYSAQWVEAQVKATGADWLNHHTCSMCGVMVGYCLPIPDDPRVYFQSACGCSWSPPRPSSYHDIADWLAMQSGGDEVRDRIMAGLRRGGEIAFLKAKASLQPEGAEGQ